MADHVGYQFEPLERGGVVLGLGPGQLAVGCAGLLAAVLVAVCWPGAVGLGAAATVVTGTVLACKPVHGRPPLAWLATAAAFAVRPRSQVTAPPPHVTPGLSGSKCARPVRTCVPGARLHEVGASADGPAMGVVMDEYSGTAAAVLRARGGAFCLLDGPGQVSRLAGWASVLDSLSTQNSPVARLQWCQRAVPADSEALLAHLRRAGNPAGPSFRDQLGLVEQAGPRSWRHETLLVISVNCRAKRGRPWPGTVALLRNEVSSLRSQLRSIGLVCEGILDGEATASALGRYLVAGSDGSPSHPWPLAFEEHWSELRADGLWHRTYWVAQWPRCQVGPEFLSPLLMGPGRRSFSVVMAPLPADKAARQAESARTAHLADAQLRAQGGFLETAQQRKQAEAIEGREELLAQGRGAYQLAGYVCVSAPDEAVLRAACADLERSAAGARLCLRPLYGQQRQALYWAMPLARGL